MTEIYVVKDRNRYKMRVKNHADSTEACHAVSAIVYALEGALQNNDYASEHTSVFEPGYAEIEAVCLDDTAAEDFRMALIGLMQIRLAHPEELGITQNIL